jgi:hypothetical protein
MDRFFSVVLFVVVCLFALDMAFNETEEDSCAKKHDVYECEWVLVPVTPKGETK